MRRTATLAATLVLLAACGGARTPDPEVAALRDQMSRIEQRLDRLAQAPAASTGHGAADAHGADPRQEPQTAMDLLVAGNAALLAGHPRPADLGSARRSELAQGQKPYAVIVGCSDSRCPPEHVFGAGLGDLFVVRTAGNVVPDEALASVEYAVAHLGARLVVCVGHTRCGAVKASIAGTRETPAVGGLIDRIQPAVDGARAEGRTGADLVERTVVHNAYRTREELRTRSALLAAKAAAGEVRFVVARQVLDDGQVEWLDADGLRTPAPPMDPLARAPRMARTAAAAPVPPPAPAAAHGHAPAAPAHSAPSRPGAVLAH
jgi:carbonic anhydrase